VGGGVSGWGGWGEWCWSSGDEEIRLEERGSKNIIYVL
jgi:hypothetical protein